MKIQEQKMLEAFIIVNIYDWNNYGFMRNFSSCMYAMMDARLGAILRLSLSYYITAERWALRDDVRVVSGTQTAINPQVMCIGIKFHDW